MAEIVLNVEVRERTGTGGARVARRAGLVPGVLYGGDKDPVAIAVKANDFRKALYTGKLLGHLVTLKYGDETQPVIAKAVDMHPVTDAPWHFDLYRVDAHQQIRIAVAVHFRNHEASPGIKRGGTVNIVTHGIMVRCPADAIPQGFDVDLTGLEINYSKHLSDITIPDNVKVLEHGDITLVTIVPPSGYAEEMKQAAEAAAAAAAAAKAAADAPPAPTGAPGATPVAAAPEKK